MPPTQPSPPWYEGPLPEHSFRSLFKWGAPGEYKHPNAGLVSLMQARLGLDPSVQEQPPDLGLENVPEAVPPGLDPWQIQALQALVGAQNVFSDIYTRLRASYGQALVDVLRLRAGRVENLPDVVVAPRDKSDVEKLVAWCHDQRLPLYVVSGRSSVTRGCEATCGGVTLDMRTHMNKVLHFNETDQTITVQPGISGPELETALNQAPARFGATRAYTCGHFPQSFEFSTVGGWVLTRGAGQNSTYYGKIEDLVFAQEYATPRGTLKTGGFPRQATGPDVDQILIGSEGAFGVLTEVTLKVFRHLPGNRRRFSFMFHDWPAALAACRAVLQCEAGRPSVFRLSDPEETDIALHLYGVAGTPAEGLLKMLGFRPGEMCLLLGSTEGEAGFSRNLRAKIGAICRGQGGFPLELFGVARRWEHGRFRDPYLRDDLLDFGVLIDTLECSTTWERLPAVYAGVRAVIKERQHTICMTHLSHAYPQGANLYFIFITRENDLPDYLRLQYAILEAIVVHGAALSHHHGIGKAFAPWLADQVGEAHMALLGSLKRHFDPRGILNPGGTLGLDLNPEQKRKIWGLEEGGNDVAARLA